MDSIATKLKRAIEKYLAADTTRKAAGNKGVITKLVTELRCSLGIEKARDTVLEVLKDFDSEKIPAWLIERFTPGSLYEEGDRVMGWFYSGQVQAEELPLYRSGKSYTVTFFGHADKKYFFQRKGFAEAESFPLQYWENHIEVKFPIDRSLAFAEYKYALPCRLQWYRNDEGLVVSRSIISEGFWQAWKWWDGAKWWYLEKRPELFVDAQWWDEAKEVLPNEAPSNALVLSPFKKLSTPLNKIEGYVKYL